jgi:hypothetical protein
VLLLQDFVLLLLLPKIGEPLINQGRHSELLASCNLTLWRAAQ